MLLTASAMEDLLLSSEKICSDKTLHLYYRGGTVVSTIEGIQQGWRLVSGAMDIGGWILFWCASNGSSSNILSGLWSSTNYCGSLVSEEDLIRT